MSPFRKALYTAAVLLAADAAQAQSVDHILQPSAVAQDSWSPRLLLREQTPASGDRSRPILYIHGATFPSAASMMFRFDGGSWADSLNRAGFDVFALDFAGYGGSERYPGMAADSDAGSPVGRAPVAAGQIERAVEFIARSTGARKIDIIAHSWGSIPAGLFAGKRPDLVGRLVLFGPIGRREGPLDTAETAWTLVTVEQQHARFVRTVPSGVPGVLIEQAFPRWGETFLDSDTDSRTRSPASVKVPSGPSADVADSWAGRFPYDPSLIRAPTLIIRGEWDTTSPDPDMSWLEQQLTGAERVEAIKIPRATHLMHLERGRTDLYRAVEAFLLAASDATIRTSPLPVVFELTPDPDRH